jgi:hypothetical protein
MSRMCRVRKDPRMSWRKEQRPEKEVSILQIKGVRPEYEGEGSNEKYSFIFISKQLKMVNFSCEAFLCDYNTVFLIFRAVHVSGRGNHGVRTGST